MNIGYHYMDLYRRNSVVVKVGEWRKLVTLSTAVANTCIELGDNTTARQHG